ncbi:metallophosphoesterase [Halobacteriales archaeon SW_7_71_33]|nr:MAG: metallophosphoesterase [Halobacteriales archaeon SW_7_71_33]
MSEGETGASSGPASSTVFGRAGPVLARFARPRCPAPARLAVLGDPHLSTRRVGSWKLFHRTERRLAAAVEDCNRRGVDAAVFVGDLTENGHPADFRRVHELLDRLEAPALAVPGNHDVPAATDSHETPPVGAFERRFTPRGLPFHATVGGVDVVGLNTASAPDGRLHHTHDGEVSPAALDRLSDALADAETALVVGHHNLSTARELDVPVGDWRSSFPLRDADDLLAALREGDAPLYCSGHLHVPAVGRPDGAVRELVVPPLCSFPQGYALVRVGPAGTIVRHVPVADGAGVTEAYLAALNDKSKSEAVVRSTAEQLRRFPLADERMPAVGAEPTVPTR